jgi:sulfonate transport system ATP-binding protein
VWQPSEESRAMMGSKPADTVIEIRNVIKAFGGDQDSSRTLALDGVNFTVNRGDLIGIVGPSGCGKSTLLNLVAGLEPFNEGEIFVEGQKVKGPREIGYVFQQDTLLPWRDVRGNAEFGLEIKGRDREKRWDVAQGWLKKLGLGKFHGHYPHQLSGGMRKRLQLSCILATEPNILLMDEPFGALDAQTRTLIEDDFLRLWREAGLTVLFVTHDLSEAISMCTRVVIMSARPGRVKSQYAIDLPRDLSTTDRKLQAQYHELFAQIWADLKDEVGQHLE